MHFVSFTATLIDAVCVPVFKTLYLPSDTASAHARLGFSAAEAVLSLEVAERTCPCQQFSHSEI
jgi:hypothetical protein